MLAIISVSYNNYPGMIKVTCVTCAEKMHINNSANIIMLGAVTQSSEPEACDL